MESKLYQLSVEIAHNSYTVVSVSCVLKYLITNLKVKCTSIPQAKRSCQSKYDHNVVTFFKNKTLYWITPDNSFVSFSLGGVRCSSVVRLFAHGAIFRSSQCSTTGVTKAVVCVILSVGWCI